MLALAYNNKYPPFLYRSAPLHHRCNSLVHIHGHGFGGLFFFRSKGVDLGLSTPRLSLDDEKLVVRAYW